MRKENIIHTLDIPQGQKVSTQSGAWAAVKAEEGQECLQVYSDNNELIFEFDPQQGVTKLVIPHGDLELITKKGDIHLNSSQAVNISGENVAVNAEHTLSLNVIKMTKNMLRPLGSSLSLLPNKLKLGSQHIDLTAQKSTLDSQEVQYRGERFRGVLEDSKVVAENIETVAKSLVQKSENFYSVVKKLSQLRSGRVRQLVDGALHIRSQKTLHKTDEDFKVRANEIQLG